MIPFSQEPKLHLQILQVSRITVKIYIFFVFLFFTRHCKFCNHTFNAGQIKRNKEIKKLAKTTSHYAFKSPYSLGIIVTLMLCDSEFNQQMKAISDRLSGGKHCINQSISNHFAESMFLTKHNYIIYRI